MTGGGNIRPVCHKVPFLALNQHISHESAPRDTTKSPLWPTDENSSPPLLYGSIPTKAAYWRKSYFKRVTNGITSKNPKHFFVLTFICLEFS